MTRTLAWIAAAATLALFVVANWNFIALATRTHPGCVPVSPDKPAASQDC